MGLFKAYDVRGIYGKELTEKEAYLCAYYIVKYKKLKKFIVARDGRLSGESLTKFFLQGLLDREVEIKYAGEISTPNFYFSIFNDVENGVMITASHNPKEYNGFKFMINEDSFDSRNGLFDLEKLVLKDEDNVLEKFIQKKDKILQENFNTFLEKNKINFVDYKKEYFSFLIENHNKILDDDEKKIIKKIKFSLDFSSGMSSIVNKKLYDFFGYNVKYYNDRVDGNFPIHSPDPLKAKDFLMGKEDNSFFTAAFDGDGDRIVFFDENKNLVFADYIIAKFIDFFSNAGYNNFVLDLRVSKIIKDIQKKKKLNIFYIRVGRAFYKDELEKVKGKYGAELSGHIFFQEFYYLDNPDIALLYMLKIIAISIKTNQEMSFKNIFEKYKIYFKLPEYNLKITNADLVLNYLSKKYQNKIVSKIDGVSFDFGECWYNIRRSNTEELVRINLEGINEDIAKKYLSNLIKEINIFEKTLKN